MAAIFGTGLNYNLDSISFTIGPNIASMPMLSLIIIIDVAKTSRDRAAAASNPSSLSNFDSHLLG